jgi:mRNA-degrading endonuclease toxin of MazEF toxin-antitoxin module
MVRAIPSEVGLGRSDGMPKTCVVNTDNLATIPKRWLDQKITMLSDDRILELDAALAFSLELE